MNEFEILSAFVRIFEKGVSQTLLRLRHFDQQFSRFKAGWQHVKIDVGVPGLQQVQNQLSGVNQQLNRMKQETDRVTTGFRQIQTVVTAIRAILAGAVVGFIARTTFEFEKLNLRLLAFTHNQRVANQLFRDLLQFSGRTFFDISEVTDAAAQLLNMRVATDSVIPSLRVLNDIAIATGRSIADISFPLIDIAQKQHAFQRDLIQFAIRGLPIYEALSRVTGKWGNELEEATTKGEIGFNEVVEALKLLASEMSVGAKTVETDAAAFRRAMNELKVAATEAAPALTPVLKFLEFMTKALHTFVLEWKELPIQVALAGNKINRAIIRDEEAIRKAFGLDLPAPQQRLKEYYDEVIKQLESESAKVTEAQLNIWKEAGEPSGEAFVREAGNAITEGMGDADFFGSDFRKKQREALDKFATQMTLFVAEFGREAALQMKQFPFNFNFETGKFAEPLQEEFDQAIANSRIFAEEIRATMEELVPQWGFQMAHQMAIASQAMKDAQGQIDVFRGHLVDAFNAVTDALELGTSAALERGKNTVRSFLDQTEFGIRLAAINIRQELTEGDVGKIFKSIGEIIAKPFDDLGIERTAGGLAGAFKAGSAEALKLRRTSLEFDKRQVSLLQEIADNTKPRDARPIGINIMDIGSTAMSILPGF